jgi:hypothetical protein
VPERRAQPRPTATRTTAPNGGRRGPTPVAGAPRATRATTAGRPSRAASQPTSPRQGLPSRSTRHAPFDLNRVERHERFTLIEFVWDIPSGIQPVILAERKLLH